MASHAEAAASSPEHSAPKHANLRRERYSAVAILLHWLIAGAILVQVLLGWRMEDLEGFSRLVLLQSHKSLGIAILVLSVARLAWRLMNPPPKSSADAPALERTIARWAHGAFYVALLALPLTGWALSSIGHPGAIRLWGGLAWPALPFLSRLSPATLDAASEVMSNAHGALAWVMLALMALHIAGALKHQFVSRDATLSRMAPLIRPGAWLEPRLAIIPAVALGLAALAYAPTPKPPPPRPKVTELAKADAYLDIVAPALDRRCAGCHNDEEARGGLSLASYDGLALGALHGAVIRPGDAARSELYRRITLPANHAEFMPRDNKTPLSASEVAAIRWWIAAGAPRDVPVGRLRLTPEARAALEQITGLSPADPSGPASEGPLPVVAPANPALIAKVDADGFIVRKLKRDSNLLEADYIAGVPLTPEAMDDLVKLAPQLLRLNLRGAGLTDAMARPLAGFPHLRQLRLESNPVTDSTADTLSAARSLAYLNLANTKVTDAGLAKLAALPQLKRLYVWGCPATAAAAQKVRAQRSDLVVYAGLTAKDVPPATKVMEPVN